MKPTATVTLRAGKAQPFWHKESLVFSGAIANVTPEVTDVAWVAVCDHQKKLIGHGFFNPQSQYRVRLLSFASEPANETLADLLRARIQRAIDKRRHWGLPSAETTTYRLLNSEGDSLSGVTVDVFDTQAVVVCTAAWAEMHRELITETLQASGKFSAIHWRSSRSALKLEGLVVEQDVTLPESNVLVVKENGLSYHVDIGLGQKTGFYCDQRDNRLLVQKHAKGRRVLDCYCYTGSFALNAAQGGAEYVKGIDSSAEAILLATRNAELNHLHSVVFERARVNDVLSGEHLADFIILDPPKLSPRESHIGKATQHYLTLNAAALAQLPAGGLLLTCSCSNAMTESRFLQVIKKAARSAGKTIKILSVTHAAKDHPYSNKAKYGDYLKAVLLTVV